jgi:hypothetical protein
MKDRAAVSHDENVAMHNFSKTTPFYHLNDNGGVLFIDGTGNY